jgi:enoyl-CoA hydratase
MDKSLVLCEEENEILTIKLNRPEKLNAINEDILKELNQILDSCSQNESIKALIITGAGDKAFAAGADINEISKLTIFDVNNYSRLGQSVFNKIECFNKPVIGLINGYALGGGFELALACHIRLCSDNARMGLPEIKLGLIPGFGGTQRLSKMINPGRALYYILSGEQIDAEEAYRLGIVSEIYSPMNLHENGIKFARNICEKSVDAVEASLKTIAVYKTQNLEEGLSIESSLFSLCAGTANFAEGISAFKEKREPVFNKLVKK